jgi:hypothetical protein
VFPGAALKAFGVAQRRAVAAMPKPTMAQETSAEARRAVDADALRETPPKLDPLMAGTRGNVLADTGLRLVLPQTAHKAACGLRRTGATAPASTGPGSPRPTSMDA